MDWSIYVSPGDFDSMQTRLEATVARREAAKRGWTSYTDALVITTQTNAQMAKMLEMLTQCTIRVRKALLYHVIVTQVFHDTDEIENVNCQTKF